MCFKVFISELQVLSSHVYSQFCICFYSLVYHLYWSRDYKTGKGHADVLGSGIPDRGNRVITRREILQVSPQDRGTRRTEGLCSAQSPWQQRWASHPGYHIPRSSQHAKKQFWCWFCSPPYTS